MYDPDHIKGIAPDTSNWKPAGRSMAQGLLPASMGKKVKAPKIDLRSDEDKAWDEASGAETNNRRPNRLERRRQAATAPRNIRVLIRENKWLYQFRHVSHPNAPKRWLDPEAYQKYLECKDQECTTSVNGKFRLETHGAMIRRQTKNAVRRKRQGRSK
jgi:hypothetical protein